MALPVVLDLSGRQVVVVGGGPIAERRIRAFIAEGARVLLIAPDATPSLTGFARAGTITWLRRNYSGAIDLAEAHLVHTATGDPKVDRRVMDDADAARCWCINASDGLRTPAAMSARVTLNLDDGPITVAVNASNDPRRAVRIRDALATHLLAGTVALQRIRPVRNSTPDPSTARPSRPHLLEKAS